MKFFSIYELSKSATADKFDIPNSPSQEAIENLTALADNVLDPLREAFGAPVYVNSGFRSPVLNKFVGGATASHHLKGMAADITAGSPAKNKRLFDLAKNLAFTQLIWEKGGRWVHVSYDPKNLKRQILAL